MVQYARRGVLNNSRKRMSHRGTPHGLRLPDLHAATLLQDEWGRAEGGQCGGLEARITFGSFKAVGTPKV